MYRAVFLDRDGTLIVDKHYLADPNHVELLDGVGAALALLQKAGYRLYVVTNQSGIGRGYFSMSDVDACNQKLSSLLENFSVTIDGWYVCPHAPYEQCSCRKPMPGLLTQAQSEHFVDLDASFVIGDKDSDVLAGETLGVKGYLVLTGSGRDYAKWAHESGNTSFSTLLDAASFIVSNY